MQPDCPVSGFTVCLNVTLGTAKAKRKLSSVKCMRPLHFTTHCGVVRRCP